MDGTERALPWAHLVVVEVPVDGEPVRAQALQVSGAASLRPSLNLHEGSVAPRPQQLRTVVFLRDAAVISCGWNVNTNNNSLTTCIQTWVCIPTFRESFVNEKGIIDFI